MTRLWERIERPSILAVAGAAVAALMPMTAAAHIVYGSPSIYQLVVDADLVVRARIVDPSATHVSSEPGMRRPVVVATPLQVFKGGSGERPIRFAQHGHGVAQYETGDEALLFLRRIERSRELDQLGSTGGAHWVSLQEHDSAFTMTPEERPAFDAAVNAWAAAAAVDDPSRRLDSLRAVTLELLRADEPRLARSALRDVVLMGGVLVTDATAPALVSISHDPTIEIGVRLGVLTVLEQQNRVDGPNRWAGLLQTTPAPDLIAVVRAVAAHPSSPVTAELVKLLEQGDSATAAAAAVSLGVPGNDAAVAPLTRAIQGHDKRLQLAAIRGLGRIGTEQSEAALQEAAQRHPDSSIRRRAAGEVARLEAR